MINCLMNDKSIPTCFLNALIIFSVVCNILMITIDAYYNNDFSTFIVVCCIAFINMQSLLNYIYPYKSLKKLINSLNLFYLYLYTDDTISYFDVINY